MSEGPASPHDTADWFEQLGFALRFGWGPNGLRRLAPGADVVVIVDVLSFSTAVDIALGRGAIVLPYRWHDGSEHEYAQAHQAVAASKHTGEGLLSLRPSSLTEVPTGMRLVLPSPNGSALAFGAVEAGARAVMVGSLRNATAVGRAAASARGVVAVIAAGERWRGSTGPLRPAIEDLLGAGAILAAAAEALAGGAEQAEPVASPEASVAMAALHDAKPVLADRIRNCGSGRELIDRGFGADVELAVDLDASSLVPTLSGVELTGAEHHD